MIPRALLLAGLVATAACARDSATPAPATPADQQRVVFDAQIVPLLKSRCSPCHFEGGRMYERLPFDDPGTIRTLGTKLFTRIKDERDQAVIRAFLGQSG